MSSSSTLRQRALVLHAYSADNVGDGLLVDLALDLVTSATPNAEITVVATEAQTFDKVRPIQWRPRWFPDVSDRPRLKRVGFLATIVLGPHRTIRHHAAHADLIVAVGGGYLRGGTFSPALKSLGAHFGQLALSARHGTRAVYLSQSVGPFLPGYARLIRRRLGAVRRVFVRDDRSQELLSELPNVTRAPDLAVLEFARKFQDVPRSSTLDGGRVTVVARHLDRPRNYVPLLQSLAERPQTSFALQSTIGGNDDTAFTAKFQNEPAPSLAEVLEQGNPHIVISTRLHGSMAALLSGHPTIHLSYERKGWGAFEDLGLDEYVLNAREATDLDVWALVEQILADPSGYWAKSATRLEHIENYREQIVSALREAAE